jgi:hypothetical protein
MKILFIGGEKDNFTKLVTWINDLTDHEAYICEKNAQDTDGNIIAAPISDPDVMVVTQNCAYMERSDEEAMGITSRPKRVFYFLGAPSDNRKIGISYFDWRFRAFNKYFASYTPLDALHYRYWSEYHGDYVLVFGDNDLMWLPYPDDVENKTQTLINPDGEFTISHALSSRAMNGGYSKQTDLLIKAQRNLGFKLDIIHDVNRDEAWDRIKASHLYFGNMNRGAVSVSEKEAMSFGIPAMSWIKAEERAAYETMGTDFPLINVTPDSLEGVIQTYMTTPSLCVTKGQESFDWMHTNYTPQAVADYWIDKLSNL